MAKINLDRGCVVRPYGNHGWQALCAVYDGHGVGGEYVSQYAMGEVQRLLEDRLRSLVQPPTRGGGRDGGRGRSGTGEGGSDDEGGDDDGGGEGEEEATIKEAMREAFLAVDRGLPDEPDIEVRSTSVATRDAIFRRFPSEFGGPARDDESASVSALEGIFRLEGMVIVTLNTTLREQVFEQRLGHQVTARLDRQPRSSQGAARALEKQ